MKTKSDKFQYLTREIFQLYANPVQPEQPHVSPHESHDTQLCLLVHSLLVSRHLDKTNNACLPPAKAQELRRKSWDGLVKARIVHAAFADNASAVRKLAAGRSRSLRRSHRGHHIPSCYNGHVPGSGVYGASNHQAGTKALYGEHVDAGVIVLGVHALARRGIHRVPAVPEELFESEGGSTCSIRDMAQLERDRDRKTER